METAANIMTGTILILFMIRCVLGSILFGKHCTKTEALYHIAIILVFMTFVNWVGFKQLIKAIEAIGQ